MKWIEIWAEIQVIASIVGAILALLAMIFCGIMIWRGDK